MWAVFFVNVVIWFAFVEGFALKYAKRQATLSYCIAWLGVHFPLSIWIFGVITGALAVHFFWPYCPFGGSAG